MAAETEQKIGPTKDGKVNVKLAHPLTVRDLVNLGLDPDVDANVNDVIEVQRDQAMSLIGSGFVQVDPSDHAGVVAVLDGEKAAEGVEPSATSGNTKPLTGDDLEAALGKRGLPSQGTADEKRAAVAAYDAKV